MLYITNTEKDTWEVRKMGRDIAPLARIIRWGNAWEVQEAIPAERLNLRPAIRSAIWDWIEAETKLRGEEMRPVYLNEIWYCTRPDQRPEPRPEPRQQQKEEMPVWML